MFSYLLNTSLLAQDFLINQLDSNHIVYGKFDYNCMGILHNPKLFDSYNNYYLNHPSITPSDSTVFSNKHSILILKTQEEKLNYHISIAKHTLNVLYWQYWSSIIIFCIVIGLVILGMYFSYIHFKTIYAFTSERPNSNNTTQAPIEPNKTPKAPIEPNNDPNTPVETKAITSQADTSNKPTTPTDNLTEINISKESLQIKTSIIGIVILLISLAFFALYLIYVYPIENIQ